MSTSKRLLIGGSATFIIYLLVVNIFGQMSLLIFLIAVLLFLGSLSEYTRAKLKARFKTEVDE
ncbi:MAG TPA: hypothetical protein VGS28_03300 [Candidatus Saccharimonadales bacterium]|nr:hypothetical protein [Candidatus Saccharimonadales bacterium]